MKLLLPSQVELSIKQIGPDLHEFRYLEHFDEGFEEWVRNTYQAVSPLECEMRGLRAFQETPLSIGIKGQCSTAQVGNTLVAEFVLWSSLGSMPLRDLIGNVFLGMTSKARQKSVEGAGQTEEPIP